jgi:hypothetical protein
MVESDCIKRSLTLLAEIAIAVEKGLFEAKINAII